MHKDAGSRVHIIIVVVRIYSDVTWPTSVGRWCGRWRCWYWRRWRPQGPLSWTCISPQVPGEELTTQQWKIVFRGEKRLRFGVASFDGFDTNVPGSKMNWKAHNKPRYVVKKSFFLKVLHYMHKHTDRIQIIWACVLHRQCLGDGALNNCFFHTLFRYQD